MAMEWLSATAADLGRGIGSGEIDAVALTEAYLEAARSHSESARIYSALTEARALAGAQAAAARARAGTRAGPLDGVPITWKDLFDTAGVATEGGSALLKGRVPERDAEVVANADHAGLVCLGKTHLSELAFSGLGYNPVTATPPCVNDPDAVPGGSSSGAAASVAFGLAAAGIGSDTGGSVRVPAAWNDLVGLKTTWGRVSLEGVLPLCARFDTVGPLCRSVEDAALLLGVLEGRDPPDLADARLVGARLLILETVALDDLEAEPAAGFDRAVARFEAAGAVITRGAIPEVAAALDLSGALYPPEAYATWGREIEARPELMFAEVRKRFLAGKSVPAFEFVRAWQELARYRAAYGAATAGYDAVLVPSAPILPPKVARLVADADYYMKANLIALRNTRIGNLMGLAGLTLPTGVPSVGVTLLGAPGSEARLLRLGAAAERALA